MSNVIERGHRTLNSYLRAYTSENRDDWDELLKFATFAYNNTVHSTTGYTPHELAFGFKIQIPNQLTKRKITYNYDNYSDKLRNDIAKSLEIARERLINAQIRNKVKYDEKTKPLDIEVNDWVLLKNMTKNHKFDNIYEGPYLVTSTSDSYIEILKNGERKKIHKNLVKKTTQNNETRNSM